jgi:hypothetical protein
MEKTNQDDAESIAESRAGRGKNERRRRCKKNQKGLENQTRREESWANKCLVSKRGKGCGMQRTEELTGSFIRRKLRKVSDRVPYGLEERDAKEMKIACGMRRCLRRSL